MKQKQNIKRELIGGVLLSVCLLFFVFVAPSLFAKANTEANEKSVCKIKNTIAYTSSEYGFTIRQPKWWRKNYQICVTKKDGANIADFEFSVRRYARAKFEPAFTLHLWNQNLPAVFEDPKGEVVSEKEALLVTAETYSMPKRYERHEQSVTQTLESFRWINLRKLQDAVNSL